MRSRLLPLLVLGSLVVLAACGSDNNVLGPQFQPEIVNEPDAFQFQATGVTGVTQTLNYTWQNSGVSANVNQSSSLSGGSATLIVRDSAGQIVHQMDLSNGGTFESLAGQTGAWTVQVILSDLDGTLNFRLEKRA